MAVRHQHDIDRGQRLERDAGIVVPLRPGKGKRRGAHRPHRIDQDVEPRGLDQPARVADKGQPHLVAARRAQAACRRGGSAPIRARPRAAGRPRTASAALRQAISAARRRDRRNAGRRNDRTPGRNRFSCGTTRRTARQWPRRAGVQPQHMAAGDFHGPIGPKTPVSARGRRGHETRALAQVSLTFEPCGGLTPPLLEKMFFSTRRPVLEAGGQRPTARCALGRESVWIIFSLAPHFAGRGSG